MSSQYSERYSVVFLLDQIPAQNIVLLKRAAWKKFAPNLYTGIGGQFLPDENHMHGALRELKEEVGIEPTELIEFARCHIFESNKLLHYYWLVYPHKKLPDCTEGILEWVSIEKVLEKNIIPTTQFVIQEWQNRKFNLYKPFTIYLHEVKNGASLERKLERVAEGLDSIVQ